MRRHTTQGWERADGRGFAALPPLPFVLWTSSLRPDSTMFGKVTTAKRPRSTCSVWDAIAESDRKSQKSAREIDKKYEERWKLHETGMDLPEPIREAREREKMMSHEKSSEVWHYRMHTVKQ